MREYTHSETFSIRDERFVPDLCPSSNMAPEVVAEYMLLGTGYHLVDGSPARVKITVELLSAEEEGGNEAA